MSLTLTETTTELTYVDSVNGTRLIVAKTTDGSMDVREIIPASIVTSTGRTWQALQSELQDRII